MLPDPHDPRIVNGGFERVLDDGHHPAAWHYLRQAKTMDAPDDAVKGIRFLRFTNRDPGRGCRALQGLAIDGRHISRLHVTVSARGRDISKAPESAGRPGMVITFYDRRRAAIDTQPVGRWEGTFDWRTNQTTLDVPLAAREAIVRIGLLGGTGELDIDAIRLQGVLEKDER